MMQADERESDRAWRLVYRDYDPATEGRRETLCAIGNGYFVTRAASPDSTADATHYPGTYIAGLYDRLESVVAGHRSVDESLVNLPNWLAFTFSVADGPWFRIDAVRLLEYCQTLDLRQGTLTRTLRFADEQDRVTRLETELLAHMRHEHLGIFRATLTAENWSGTLTLRSALDGRVSNSGVERYQTFAGQHLEALDSGRNADGDLWLRVRTVQSRIEIALACRHRLQMSAGSPEQPQLWRDADAAVAHLGEEMRCEIGCGQHVVLEKRVALTTSRDRASSECVGEALGWVSHWDSYHALRMSHQQEWERLWRHCDLVASLRAQDLTALRLHIFQLLQTASLNTVEMDAGIPARGWHGEGYRGHVFWDELFVFPFFNFRLPELARALLLYRYRRLPAARRAARAADYDGAMYPWQSGADGSEETQRWEQNPRSGHVLPDHTDLQRHIGAAVAYNVCCYYAVTGDRDFLYFYGLEMLLEIARFWAAIAVENRASGRFEIHGVMGPDEFHDRYPDAPQPGLRNNAYTNVMAAWVLWRTLELIHAIPEERSRELRQLFGVSDDELARWDRISRRMHIPFHGDVISQFEGYEALQELDWDAYRRRYGDIHRLDRILEAEGDTPNRYKVSKQADVLMLFYLFTDRELEALFARMGYRFDTQLRSRTVDYYLARTSHGSTLSRVVHSWVFARARRSGSWELFSEALYSDVADIQGGSTKNGLHLGAMAGSIDLVQRGYTGLTVEPDALRLDPTLPKHLPRLELSLLFRQSWLNLAISHERLRVQLAADAREALSVRLRDGAPCRLQPGDEASFPLQE